MSQPLVSIIIPCYNQAHFLSEAIDSIKQQTYENWECIVVNDGSPDNTEKIANKIIALDQRIKYLFQENGGLSSARNYGIENSKGDFILLLDADDRYHSSFIEKGIKLLINNPEIGIVTSWLQKFDNKNTQYPIYKTPGGNKIDFLFGNHSIGTSLFRKQCWKEVGGYDATMKRGYEDWEFYIRVVQKWNVEVIPEVLFFYRIHNISMAINASHNHDSEIRKYIFMKHKYLYIENYERTLNYFINMSDYYKRKELRRVTSKDFKLGRAMLKPLRIIRQVFLKKK